MLNSKSEEFSLLMEVLSRTRPNGSAALRKTLLDMENWLSERKILYKEHRFRIYPYFFVCTGLWLVFSRTLLAIAFWLDWGWWTLIISLISLIGGLVDVAWNIHLVTWPGSQEGVNLLVEYPARQARQDLILCAHYDSKTELLDHYQRMFFLKRLRLGIILTLGIGLLSPIHVFLAGSITGRLFFLLGGLAVAVLLILAWGLGANLTLGGLKKPSQGAVDNGAACAILLDLANQLKQGEIHLQQTNLTITLFCGEEVNMQGSHAYAQMRDWPLPAAAINLEVMAQNGDYVYWEKDGTSLKLLPTSAKLNRLLEQCIHEVTGLSVIPKEIVNSDAGQFLLVGISATTLGTVDKEWEERGLHQASDNLERVVMSRLPEAVDILKHLIVKVDIEGLIMTERRNLDAKTA